MRINHLAVYVEDLERTKDFYVKYFDVTPNEMYRNPKTGLMTYFLTFSDGTRLEIMSRPGMIDRKKHKIALGYTHLAISVGSKEKVDSLTEQLKNDGYEVISNPRLTGDGYYESCILDFENNQIEIVE